MHIGNARLIGCAIALLFCAVPTNASHATTLPATSHEFFPNGDQFPVYPIENAPNWKNIKSDIPDLVTLTQNAPVLEKLSGMLGTAITVLKKWDKRANTVNDTAHEYLNVKAMCMCPVTDGGGFTGGRNDTTRAECQEPGHPNAVCGPAGGGTWLPSDVAGDLCIEKTTLDDAGCFDIESEYTAGPITVSSGDLNTTCANLLAWTNGLTVAMCRKAEQYVPKALEFVKKLDIVADWITCSDPSDDDSCVFSSVWAAAMEVCGTLENIKDVIDAIIKYINKFTDGYHLGAYGEVRSALHFCVPWRDKNLHFPNWVELPAGADDFSIGAKFRSFVIAKKHQMHLQLGGFEARLFGKSIPLAPSLSVSGDLDMFRMLHKDTPFGIGAGGGSAGSPYSAAALVGGTATSVLAWADTKQCFPINWDENSGAAAAAATSVLTGENLYHDFNLAPWEHEGVPVHTVLTAGVNLNWDFTKRWDIPKPPKPPFQIWPPFVTARIWIQLDYGFGWHSIANTMRDKIRDALNERAPDWGPEVVPITVFDRNHHTLQAPDVTNDRGNFLKLGLSMGLDVNVGIDIGPIKIGITIGISFFVKVRPAADGGVLDLNAALVEVLQNSADNPHGSCDPVYSTTETFACETGPTTWNEGGACSPDWTEGELRKSCGGLCRIPYAERPEDREFHADDEVACQHRYSELWGMNLVAQICPPSNAPAVSSWPPLSDQQHGGWSVSYPTAANGDNAAVGISTCPDINLAEKIASGECIAVGQGDLDFAHLLEGALIKCCPPARRRLRSRRGLQLGEKDPVKGDGTGATTAARCCGAGEACSSYGSEATCCGDDKACLWTDLVDACPRPGTEGDLCSGKGTPAPTASECPNGGVRTYSSTVEMCNTNCEAGLAYIDPRTDQHMTAEREWIDTFHFIQDGCVLNSSVTETVGWTGNGCSPLHTGFTSAVSCFLDSDCAVGERCIGADVTENSYGICGTLPASEPAACGEVDLCPDLPSAACPPLSLWNNLDLIASTTDVTDCGIALTSGSCTSSPPPGRVCRDGAAAKECTPATTRLDSNGNLNEAAVMECSPESRLTVCDLGACVPITSVYSESVYHGMENVPAPQHTIATYANIGMDLDLGMGLAIKISAEIDLKFFKKKFIIFEWSDTFKPSWAPKYYYKLNTAVEHSYQNDTTLRDGSIPATAELLDVCLDPGPDAGASTFNVDEVPDVDEGPPTDPSEMAESLVDIHDYALDILMVGWRSSQMCIDGQLAHEWQLDNLPPPTEITINGVTTATGAGATDPNYPCHIFKNDGSSHVPLSPLGGGMANDFPCGDLPIELPRFLGCMDQADYAICSYTPPWPALFPWNDLGSDSICASGEVNLASMMVNPALGLVPSNYRHWFWLCPQRASFINQLTTCINTKGDAFHAATMASTAEPPVPRIEMGPRLDPDAVEGCCGDGTVSVFEECDPGSTSSDGGGGSSDNEFARVDDAGWSLETVTDGDGFFIREVGAGGGADCASHEVVPCKGNTLTRLQDMSQYNPDNPDADLYDADGKAYVCRTKKLDCNPPPPLKYSSGADTGFSLEVRASNGPGFYAPCKNNPDIQCDPCSIDILECNNGATVNGDAVECYLKNLDERDCNVVDSTGGAAVTCYTPCGGGGDAATCYATCDDDGGNGGGGNNNGGNYNGGNCSETCELHCTGNTVKECTPDRPHDFDWTEAMADLTSGRNCSCVDHPADLWSSYEDCFEDALRVCEGSWECGNCLPSLLTDPVAADGGLCGGTNKPAWTSSGAQDAFEDLLDCLNDEVAPTEAPTPVVPWPYDPSTGPSYWTVAPSPSPTTVAPTTGAPSAAPTPSPTPRPTHKKWIVNFIIRLWNIPAGGGWGTGGTIRDAFARILGRYLGVLPSQIKIIRVGGLDKSHKEASRGSNTRRLAENDSTELEIEITDLGGEEAALAVETAIRDNAAVAEALVAPEGEPCDESSGDSQLAASAAPYDSCVELLAGLATCETDLASWDDTGNTPVSTFVSLICPCSCGDGPTESAFAALEDTTLVSSTATLDPIYGEPGGKNKEGFLDGLEIWQMAAAGGVAVIALVATGFMVKRHCCQKKGEEANKLSLDKSDGVELHERL